MLLNFLPSKSTNIKLVKLVTSHTQQPSTTTTTTKRDRTAQTPDESGSDIW